MLKNLIRFVESHGNEVVRANETSITAMMVYCKDGVAYEVPETFPATWDAAREWLGY